MPRKWEPREMRMMADYLLTKHPKARHLTRVRLGPLPRVSPEFEAMGIGPQVYTVGLHWADGLALYPDKTLLFECKIKLQSTALGQILTNRRLFYKTDMFRDRWHLPLEPWVIYAYPDREVLEMLDINNIKHEQFRPSYIEEYYIAKLRGY